jgi:PAS domain S-box-containing protein
MAAFSLSLGALVYLKGRPASVRRHFNIFTLAIAAWLVCGFLLYSNIDAPRSVFWAKIAFAAGSMIILSLYYLLLLFPDLESFPSAKHIALVSFLGCSFALLSIFSPLLVRDVSYQGIFKITVDYGPLYLPFTAYALIALTIGVTALLRRLGTASGRRKLQIQYFLLGAAVPAAGVFATNLILPLLFKISDLAPFGRFLALIFLPMTAHAIIRYRLMDIKLFIQKSVVYVCAIVVSASIFLILAWLVSSVTAAASISLAEAVALAVLVGIFFQPMKRWIQISLNRYVYREIYDYQTTVREASRRLSTILDLQSLLDYLTQIVTKTFKLEKVEVYLRDHPKDTFSLKVLQRTPTFHHGPSPFVLSEDSALISYIQRERRMLIRDEVPRTSADQQLAAAVNTLQALGGDIAIPFWQAEMLTGFLLVGPKLSGDPYFSEDIDLLLTLASQASIAIENAQLYRQVVLVNEYIENILATMESGVIAVASDGTVTLFNSAAERLTELDAKKIRGKPLQHLPRSIAEPLEATLADGRPRAYAETLIQDGTGGLTPVMCSTTSLKDRSATILGAVAVFSDLTRVKQLEGEKRRAERLASIGALASGIAHEIKNPLVAIRTFAELLPERFNEEDFHTEFSQVVMREIERIDDLVARLRGLARPPAQPLGPVNLRDPILETLALLRGQLMQARVTVNTTYDEDLPFVAGDPAQLKQLFLNLFVNAIEAMEPGGALSIRLTNRENRKRQSILIEIADTGPGIPEHLLGKIFDPFVTTKQQGSGLGLSICRGIAAAHRATLRAQNNPNGRGATFLLEFPALVPYTPAEIQPSSDVAVDIGS